MVGAAKATASGYAVVIEDAKHSKVHALGVVIIGKAEAVVGIEPTVVGMTARSGFVQYGIHGCYFFIGNVIETNLIHQAVVG